jgi:UDP-N-acetyl-D-mannosaminuronic acid dehydrogenase
VETAPDLANLIYTSRSVNDSQPHYALELVRNAIGSLQGRRIAALGLAFKPDVDDLRESPAADVVHLLQEEGAIVKAFEPFRPEGLPGIRCVPTLEEAVSDADCVVLLVNHQQFVALDPKTFAQRTPARIIVDMRNSWKPSEWQAAGFKLHRLGVGK